MDERMARLLRTGACSAWGHHKITDDEFQEVLNYIAQNEKCADCGGTENNHFLSCPGWIFNKE